VSIKILLLEDDMLFAESLIDLLEDEEYEVTHVPNGQSALDASYENRYDLYLLDINVPLINGIELLQSLRDADDTTPTIFLTSHKDEASLKQGFLSGADDFITKPFNNTELLLRLRALLKRSKKLEKKCVSNFCYDTSKKLIYYKELPLELSKREYDLLLLFLQHINAPVPKEMIFDHLWDANSGGSDGALRVYINRLKHLLPEVEIQNIRGIGYKLVS